MILAVLFQGSRETSFYYTFFSGPDREALNNEAGTYNSLIQISRQQRQPQALDRAKKIMKCSCLWALQQCILKSQDKYFWGLLLSVYQSSLVIQCCSFMLSPGNCQLIGKGSRLQTMSNIVKGAVEINLRTGSQRSWDDQILLESLSLSFPRRQLWGLDQMFPKDPSSSKSLILHVRKLGIIIWIPNPALK